MIQLKEIIENKDKVINGLKKRGFKKLNILDEIINTDKAEETRKKNLMIYFLRVIIFHLKFRSCIKKVKIKRLQY